ncbi:MAG: hypothetical protein AAF415_11650 [Pseudomonadota bacterium]
MTMTHASTGATIGRFLTSQETVELARLQQDNSVVGYSLLGMDGEELQGSGHWTDMIAPVFANVADLANKLGEELGETEACARISFDNREYQVFSVILSACRAVIVKRKQASVTEGLRSVG